jgi:hypothetical protein
VLIIEESSWTEAAEKLGGLQNLDQALDPIIDALMLNPAGFPQIAGGIRLAKTDRIERDDGAVIPALRVWFRYRLGEDRVYLLYAEEIPEDA